VFSQIVEMRVFLWSRFLLSQKERCIGVEHVFMRSSKESSKMRLWKKGVIAGVLVWICVVAVLWSVGHGGVYIVVFFAPDFAILGAVVGYMFDRFYLK